MPNMPQEFIPCSAAGPNSGPLNGHCFCITDQCCFCRHSKETLRVAANTYYYQSPTGRISNRVRNAAERTTRTQSYRDYVASFAQESPTLAFDDDGSDELRD